MPDDFLQKLRQADEQLRAQQLSPEARARLRGLLAGGRVPGRRVWPVLIPAGVAAAALAAWAIWQAPSSPELPARPQRTLAGFTLVQGQARLQQQRRLTCSSARCVLRAVDLKATFRLERAGLLRREEGAVRLLQGNLECDVDPRSPGERPVVVRVSGGIIEVLGTRFSIWQSGGEGRVTLERGIIRFVSSDGRAVTMHPGQSLTWPLAAAKGPSAAARAGAQKHVGADDAGRSRPRTITPPMAESLLDQVERLRTQQRYREAADILRRSLPLIAHPDTRERMSFELGILLTHHLADPQAACRHWQRHLDRFGRRRYGPEIEKALGELHCQGAIRALKERP